MKVLIPQRVFKCGEDYLREKGYEVIIGSASDEETIAREAADCDAMLVRMVPITKKIIDAAPKLKVIARHGVGVDLIDVAYAKTKGIYVTITPTANFNAVAEHTMMLIICCAKKMRETDCVFRSAGAEAAGKIIGEEVFGKTVGILGLGKIGMSVAKKAALGFDMTVLGYDPYIKSENVPDHIELCDKMEDVLTRADFLTIHMPLNETTRNLIGSQELSLMKNSAYIINTARGEIINETDLIRALENNSIEGGAFDVLCQTPIENEHPLMKYGNVIITPHMAGVTSEAMRKMSLQAAQGIDEVLQGKIPSWHV